MFSNVFRIERTTPPTSRFASLDFCSYFQQNAVSCNWNCQNRSCFSLDWDLVAGWNVGWCLHIVEFVVAQSSCNPCLVDLTRQGRVMGITRCHDYHDCNVQRTWDRDVLLDWQSLLFCPVELTHLEGSMHHILLWTLSPLDPFYFWQRIHVEGVFVCACSIVGWIRDTRVFKFMRNRSEVDTKCQRGLASQSLKLELALANKANALNHFSRWF